MNSLTATTNRPGRLRTLACALALGALAATPATSHADDTDVYTGLDRINADTRPNILFIIDTSTSMSQAVTGTTGDRLDNVKRALTEIVDRSNNVNVGLMRFSDPGGPVLFPIAYIDEDVTNIPNAGSVGVDVNARIDAGTDDAEENPLLGGAVDLSNSALDITKVDRRLSGASADFFAPILNDDDDAEMYRSDGTMVLDGRTLGIVYDDRENEILGLRFDAIGIPAGAQINSADILFTAKENDNVDQYSLRIFGEVAVDPAPFSSTDDDIAPDVRTWTDTLGLFVPWRPEPWNAGDAYATPDLTALVQLAVDRPGWDQGNAMAFYILNPAGRRGQRSSEDNRRMAYSRESNPDLAPVLRINYSPAVTETDSQTIGLRFRNVGVPRGATVKSAHIEFRAATDSAAADLAEFEIWGQDSGDVDTFTTTAGDLTNTAVRPRTSESVDWVAPDWVAGDFQQTADLTAVVQEIVNRTDWCGNNSMAFFVEQKVPGPLEPPGLGPGPRVAAAFDASATDAPILRIDYDENDLPDFSCINQFVQRSVVGSADDATETLSTAAVDLPRLAIELGDDKLAGFRFDDLPVAQGQTVLEATLTLTGDLVATGTSTLVISGQSHDNAPEFSSDDGDLSDRAKTGAAIEWSAPEMENTVQYTTIDIAPVINEIIRRDGWAPGNALALFIAHQSGTSRLVKSYDQRAISAAVLRIKVTGALATGGAGVKTVRSTLKEIVDGLDHRGFTPIVDTLFEAVQYYRGSAVHWGAFRGGPRGGTYTPEPNDDDISNQAVRRNTRVSHPAAWTGGDIVRAEGCTDENLNVDACATEQISGAVANAIPQSDATYITPITTACQANFIILLTDGEANNNRSAELIKAVTGASSCTASTAGEACGIELASWMNTTDHNLAIDGEHPITLYTIGFGDSFSADWLTELAEAGGGSFHEATTSGDLATRLSVIFGEILNRTTSFAAPSLSVNAFNRLFHRNDVYFSLFRPAPTIRWNGNVKRYQLCVSEDDDCELGEVLDVNQNPAVNKTTAEGEIGRIKDTAKSFWSASVDGPAIEKGGAGNEIPAPDSRIVIGFTESEIPDDEDLFDSQNEISDAGRDGILDGLTGTEDEVVDRTQELLGDVGRLSNDNERAELIAWIRGEDIDDNEQIEAFAALDRRYAFNDPLHSSPVAVTYGGTEANPVDKLFVGTNDGGLRMLNGHTGIEEWIFYPQATLDEQVLLRENPRNDHTYGMDGTPTAWVNDRDGDGKIEPGGDSDGDGTVEIDETDFVRIFIGMRRGGNHYYGFDVTPANELQTPSSTGDVSPTLLWRIDGGIGDFRQLAQSWSRPRLTKIRFGTGTEGESEERNVLVFGGGYDSQWDAAYGGAGSGNAIYFVDPDDGSLLFVVSGTTHEVSQELVVADMDYPIPTDIAMVDNDADGSTDRLFFGDLRGQLWRVDIAPDLAAGKATISPVVGRLAEISNTIDDADKRSIMYPPDVVRVPSTARGSAGLHDLVIVTTGFRPNPLDISVQDRIYAFRDFQTNAMVDADGNGIADSEFFTTIQGKLETPADGGDLLDVTDLLDFDDQANLEALTDAAGWFIDLEEDGEKSLAGPVVLAGQLFATSYLPEGVLEEATCALQEGLGRLYGLDVLTGIPLKNWDTTSDTRTLTKSDRIYALGGGIPSQAVPVFQEEGITLLVGGGGGATSIDPGIKLPRVRTYWYQEEGG